MTEAEKHQGLSDLHLYLVDNTSTVTDPGQTYVDAYIRSEQTVKAVVRILALDSSEWAGNVDGVYELLEPKIV
jgi:hypothetical protein